MIKVVGIGNVLMRDDGVGPCVVRLLDAAWVVPDRVRVEDLGTPGLDLVPHIADLEALVVVDAARAPSPPGTLCAWRGEDLRGHAALPRLGPHDPGLEAALRALDFAGRAPASVLLVGVVPGRVEDGLDLTDAVAAAVPAAIEAVLAELARLGAPATRRAVPREPDLWWRARP